MADANVIKAFRKAIRVRRASPREAKALFEAGIVESNLQNLNYGDRDSKGALQQRASTGWAHAQDPYRAALDFLDHARQANTQGGSAGALAQRVQRSAFPDRYQQHSSEAERFLRGAGATGSPGSTTTRTTSTTSLTPDAQQARRALLAQFVLNGGNDPVGLAQQYAAQNQTQTTTKVKTTSTGGTKAPSSAKGLSPLRELFWQGAGGIDAKNGQKIPQGSVSGHTDHVHVAAGPKTVVELGRIAEKRFGLHVGENPKFGGVHPVHVANSFHYKGEAIDVSGPPARMRQFAHYVASLYGIK